ncbi:NTP transferase domain-containing protein [soil metagenome]
MTPPALSGIVLAAGAGSRRGEPKALAIDEHGSPWLGIATELLLDAGCTEVIVVLGARAEDALHLVPQGPYVRVVVAADWAEGISASLRTALDAATGDAALITLVDLPSMPAAVLARVLHARAPLRQATYAGRPGHPVYIAASHWPGVRASLDADRGARDYLVENAVLEVDCTDLWDGHDEDDPAT